jgi:hypothetical protein
MPLGTPKHRATLWVFANAAWIAVSPAAALYFDRQQRNGAYPVDADSIGLPIMGIAVWVIVLLLPLNFVWWFLLNVVGSVHRMEISAIIAASHVDESVEPKLCTPDTVLRWERPTLP